MSVHLPKNACKLAFINAKGERRTLSEDEIKLNYYYNLLCLVSGHVGMVEILYPEIYKVSDDKEYLKRLAEIGMAAQKAHTKLLPINYKKGLGNNYLAFIDDKERIKALTYKYFIEIVKISGEDEGITVMPFISGVLFNFDIRDIRGYYLRYYLLKSVQTDDDENNSYVDPEIFYRKRYDYVKEQDNFADFDQKFNKIKKEATDLLKKVTTSKEFKTFVKKHIKNIRDYKFEPKYFT